ncbi:hypothetical protein RFI_32731 [Reticulomyxa filosa]|uniref:Uncharacterized protein n=1 Tax=Reticulomyxa filosa TaxID=46433 RepID=X6LVA9_RETFI|nr:hypothetical protein RFI_32731 [Reticulomyxa filosa]|eukprot:ETO04665.1 hypothetical protein RFI_32731 [Reticulomyxa filosa]
MCENDWLEKKYCEKYGHSSVHLATALDVSKPIKKKQSWNVDCQKKNIFKDNKITIVNFAHNIPLCKLYSDQKSKEMKKLSKHTIKNTNNNKNYLRKFYHRLTQIFQHYIKISIDALSFKSCNIFHSH